MRTLSAVFEDVRGLTPRALIDNRGWDRISERVGDLPAGRPASRCGFEFRLWSPEPVADFFLVLEPGSPLARHLDRQVTRAAPDSAHVSLAGFARGLAADQPDARLEASLAVLEYDIAATPRGERPAPGVFLQLDAGAEPAVPALPSFADGVDRLMDAVGWKVDPLLRRALEQVVSALPPQGRVAHLGAMPGRGSREVRLIIRGLSANHAVGLLGRLRWSGSREAVSAVLEEAAAVLPRFRLALDVSASGISPRLGFEFFPPGAPGRNHGSWLTTGLGDWLPPLDWLTRRGWCVPAKARGLREWCVLEKLFHAQGVLLLYRGISHIKLTFGDGNVLAKAYGGLYCGPLGVSAADSNGRERAGTAC